MNQREQLKSAYSSAKSGQTTPQEWAIWSGAFNRALREAVKQDESQLPTLGCLHSLWQSANRLLALHDVKRPNKGKLRKERKLTSALSKLYEDIVAGKMLNKVRSNTMSELVRTSRKREKVVTAHTIYMENLLKDRGVEIVEYDEDLCLTHELHVSKNTPIDMFPICADAVAVGFCSVRAHIVLRYGDKDDLFNIGIRYQRSL